MPCLFCNCSEAIESAYEPTFFNNKKFDYLKCANCGLVYVNPLPVEGDFIAMYPTSYQGNLHKHATGQYNWLFNQLNKLSLGNDVLDYGCGNGNFIIEALDKGFSVTGVEYNPDLVSNLANAFPNANFLTINELDHINGLYDIIFLGNVLEHLTNPSEIINLLKQKLKTGGVIVLEGPVEDNYTLAGAFRRFFFKRRKNKGANVTHAPRHIFYSNYKNQLHFFENRNFLTIKYEVTEHEWPFPSKLAASKGAKNVLLYLIAKISLLTDRLIPQSGNKFFYIGKAIAK